MIAAICLEISYSKDFFSPEDNIETIYFGGGTPSLLKENELSAIFFALTNHFQLDKVKEITLEANPDDICIEKLRIWKNCGINRLSIGVQSFKQSDLDWMNRAHTVCEAENCIHLAQQSGINNLSIDLIYGLPNLKMLEWETHLEMLIRAKVPHISAYCLTVEPKTALNKWVKNKQLQLPNDELQAQQFELLQNKLGNANYDHYEISNFSLPDCYSKHNTNYWKNKVYLGIGPSAHSFNLFQRRWNIANNQSYIKHINNHSDYFEWEELTPSNRFNELILTGLRTKWGVSIDELLSIKTVDTRWQKKLDSFIQQGDLLFDNNIIKLCKKSLLKADYISSALFDS